MSLSISSRISQGAEMLYSHAPDAAGAQHSEEIRFHYDSARASVDKVSVGLHDREFTSRHPTRESDSLNTK
jgi:hypothetical protein